MSDGTWELRWSWGERKERTLVRQSPRVKQKRGLKQKNGCWEEKRLREKIEATQMGGHKRIRLQGVRSRRGGKCSALCYDVPGQAADMYEGEGLG